LESLQEEIHAAGGAIEIVPGDVGVRADVQRAVDTCIATYGGLDALVNNAQTLEFNTPLLEITDANIEIPFRSGTLGSLYFMQACYPHLKKRGGGSIVNFGSAAGVDGLAGFGPYAIAKEGVRGLTKVAAREWGPDNIRVNVICPAGLTESVRDMMERQPEFFVGKVEEIPMGRIGDPEEDIGRAVAALVDDDLAYLTGATINLDGGTRFLN
jgi:NAD(P)-dependent dehydrogenase (short-subunit alcohol dehydrogenase family)